MSTCRLTASKFHEGKNTATHKQPDMLQHLVACTVLTTAVEGGLPCAF